MSNLKKILALVLALVMSFSLVTVSNAAFADADEITAKYEEAVDVLSGLGVFNGRTATDFDPQGYITRAEVAAIIYRVVTGDTKNVQVGIYADYNKFDDVASTAWYAGYVNYCANAEFIKGVGNNMFAPEEKVTGYQALAMILRAVGYDQNGEFTGAGWMVQTAAYAQKLHITDTVDDITLGTAATREVIAELLFRTITLVPQVTYSILGGYNNTDSIYKGELNPTLGVATFELAVKENVEYDSWGRPGDIWTSNKGNIVRPYAPKAEYFTAVTECDIAADAFGGKDKNVMAWINGVKVLNADKTVASLEIQATDVLSYIGAQGRELEVYGDRLVIVDTFLAEVTQVVDIRKDAAGHPMNKAQLHLTVFDGVDNTGAVETTDILLESTSNYTYAVGDMVLVNTATAAADNTVKAHGDVVAPAAAYTKVLGLAPSFTGVQSVIHFLADKHTIDGVEYNDANTYYLDAAQQTKGSFTWFQDLNGNLIGSALIPTAYSFGTIKDIQWITQTGKAGYAQATLVLMDGTTTSVIVTKITDGAEEIKDAEALSYTASTAALDEGLVTREYANNFEEYADSHLYWIMDNGNGTVTLVNIESADLTLDAAEVEVEEFDAKNAVVLGDGTLVNAKTQFLFAYDAYAGTAKDGMYTEFEAVTGYYNIPNYVEAVVDYVDVDGDNYADFVYVNGTPAGATGAVLFYMDNNSRYFMTDYGVYTFTGYVNGVAGSIIVYYNETYGYTEVYEELVNEANLNTMWVIDLEDGVAYNGITDVDTAAVLESEGDTNGGYAFAAKYYNAGLELNYAVRYDEDFEAVFDGDVLVVDGEVYDVTNTTRVIGELVENKVYDDNYIIHVVYNEDASDYDATEIYVFEILDTDMPEADGTTPTENLEIEAVDFDTFTATYTNTTTAEQDNVIIRWEYRLKGATTWNLYKAETAADDVAATTGTATGTLDFTGFGSTETYEVRVVVTAGDNDKVVATSDSFEVIG